MATTHQRYFEDVAVGDELPALPKGRVSTSHLMRWSAAVENWHRIHYDRPFAVEHDGLPDVVVNGSWKQQLLCQLLKDWVGSDGWLAEISYQFRGLDVVGDELTAIGRVTRTFVHRGLGFAECEIGLVNQDGRSSTPGSALVVLPLHGGPPVPYPFPPDLLPITGEAHP